MRAVFLHEALRWSGSARAFAIAARGLAARGWDVTIACRGDGDVHARMTALGLPTLPLPKSTFFGEAQRLRRALAGQPVDAIYVHTDHEQLAAATALWRASHRGVVVRRVGAGERFTAARGLRAGLRLAPVKLLCTWPEQAQLPADAEPMPTVVADVGLDPSAESPDRAAEGVVAWSGERRLVCVCDRGARARTAIVLRALAMLAPRHRELRLVLVGPGADDEELRLHAAALGVHRLVRHVSSRADDAAHRAAAHVGWVTSDGDDGAFGALDFMAAGVPVLAERGSTAARYVADAITGVHLAPNDVPATAAALAVLLARESERVAMGNAGRNRVARSFGEAAMIDGFARAASGSAERLPSAASSAAAPSRVAR